MINLLFYSKHPESEDLNIFNKAPYVLIDMAGISSHMMPVGSHMVSPAVLLLSTLISMMTAPLELLYGAIHFVRFAVICRFNEATDGMLSHFWSGCDLLLGALVTSVMSVASMILPFYVVGHLPIAPEVVKARLNKKIETIVTKSEGTQDKLIKQFRLNSGKIDLETCFNEGIKSGLIIGVSTSKELEEILEIANVQNKSFGNVVPLFYPTLFNPIINFLQNRLIEFKPHIEFLEVNGKNGTISVDEARKEVVGKKSVDVHFHQKPYVQIEMTIRVSLDTFIPTYSFQKITSD